jgi:hypothetical protein
LAGVVRAEGSTTEDLREVVLKLVLVDTGHDCVLHVVHLGMLCDFNDHLLFSQKIGTDIDFTVSSITTVKLDYFKSFLKDNAD